MGLNAVERWLADHIGLDPSSIGRDEVERVVRHRMRERGIDRVDAYLVRLSADAEEQEELVEGVLVPETWFFREPTGIAALVERGRAHLRSGTGRRFRVLSSPCATGEEPYSALIALLEAGLAADRVRVDGLDISRRAIAAAREGVYGERALRHAPRDLVERYFESRPGGRRVKDDVRDMIRFSTGNLAAPDGLPADGPYDVVLCRNVLIYFEEAARQRALATVAALLADTGLLVTGHAEASRMVAPRFVSARIPHTFAYVKAPAAVPVRPGAASPGPPPPRPRAVPTRRATDRVARVAPSATSAPTLEGARRLADEGRLDEARTACEAILHAAPASADGHYLLGIVESAAGRPEHAERALRRAVYLAPRHARALLLLALVLERRGAAAEAARLRRRARTGVDDERAALDGSRGA